MRGAVATVLLLIGAVFLFGLLAGSVVAGGGNPIVGFSRIAGAIGVASSLLTQVLGCITSWILFFFRLATLFPASIQYGDPALFVLSVLGAFFSVTIIFILFQLILRMVEVIVP